MSGCEVSGIAGHVPHPFLEGEQLLMRILEAGRQRDVRLICCSASCAHCTFALLLIG
jgi:hypothetical protein